MTLTAKGKIKEISRIYDFEVTIDSISDLEYFISYNRAHLVEISFSGELKREI